jgi:hypothetical protein
LRNKSRITYIDEVEQEVQKKFDRIDELSKNLMSLSEKLRDLEDYKTMLYRAREVFYSKGKMEETGSKISFNNMSIVTVAGILNRSDILRFSKMIFRATKGNSLMYTFDVPSE